MDDRLEKELDLLRQQYPDLTYSDRWIRLPSYPLPPDWSVAATPIAFFVRNGYPGVSPDGIYVPSGIRYRGQVPNNYKEPANPSPPFDGTWGVFSWEANNGQWHPTADPATGHNLVNWVHGFANRFKEGL